MGIILFIIVILGIVISLVYTFLFYESKNFVDRRKYNLLLEGYKNLTRRRFVWRRKDKLLQLREDLVFQQRRSTSTELSRDIAYLIQSIDNWLKKEG